MSFSSAAVGSRAGAFWQSLSWLSRAALVVLLGVVGAMALSLGLWIKDGSPDVQASFARPNFGRPGQRPGGFPQRPAGAPGGFGGQAAPGGQQGQIPGGPGGIPNRGGQGNGGNAATTPIEGTIQSVGPGNLFVMTQGGTRIVRLNASTQVIRVDGSAGSLSDLTAGSSVEVTLGQGGNFAAATEVRLLDH